MVAASRRSYRIAYDEFGTATIAAVARGDGTLPRASTNPLAMARPRPVPARRRSPVGPVELVEQPAERLGRNARSSSRTTISIADPPADVDLDAAAGRRILAGIVEHIEQGLLGQHEVERQRRQVGRHRGERRPCPSGAAWPGAAPWRRGRRHRPARALGTMAAGIETRHVQKVADEAVEPLGFAQRRAQKLVAGRLVITVAVAFEARQSANDRGKRRAEVVRDRGQHGGAQPLAPRRRDAPGRCRPPASRVRWRRRLVAHRLEQSAVRSAEFPSVPARQHDPITPTGERLVRIGTNSQRPPGSVSVPRPVG